jgi:hypothetical protein
MLQHVQELGALEDSAAVQKPAVVETAAASPSPRGRSFLFLTTIMIIQSTAATRAALR